MHISYSIWKLKMLFDQLNKYFDISERKTQNLWKHNELHIFIARTNLVHSANSMSKHKTTKLHGDEK